MAIEGKIRFVIDDDGRHVAWVSGMPSVMASGSTEDEAYINVLKALTIVYQIELDRLSSADPGRIIKFPQAEERNFRLQVAS